MILIISDKQRKIIDAYFRVLQENPDVTEVTLGMVASKVGMSRESVFRYHFRNVEEIRDKIHFLIDADVYKKTKEFVESEGYNLFDFIDRELLPLLYIHRDWLKLMHLRGIDYRFQSFLLKKYIPIVEKYLDKIGKKEILSNYFIASIFVKEILSITSTWLTDDNPEPVSLFKEKFMHLLHQSPYDLLTSKDKVNKSEG
ncbi:TetR/AcrR family transcriptional regulator [Lactococcus lactis]|uniref:Transcriptional regulator n=1 Tax=Lactococcus lactis TaxID=1358 RepID=A0A9X4NHV3_9LACT|nr:transcriptional regulator [Lactococcus lactis]KSU00990.1 hypothetical protein KF201_1442 [Lactococcus lactis subsp. lactis]MDG4983697.1 transcriptional regulator [Lactococcus lactis]MDG4986306.1 transcriptional regulator [Lactococcus lactis]